MDERRRWDKVDPNLSDSTLATIRDDFKFTKMTPVQAATLPIFLSHKDVVVQAQTGSGKTLAFVVPALEIMLRRRQKLNKYEVGVIVVSPTQELAEQIHAVFSRFLQKHSNLTMQLATGGSNPKAFERKFIKEGANIIIATPGRLCSMLTHVRNLDTRQVEVLVLDEADRLLDMGFDRQIRTILNRLPKQRRTGLFSATQTQQVSELVKAGLRNPVNIDVQVSKKRKRAKNQSSSNPSSSSSQQQTTIPDTLQNWYVVVKPTEKLVFLSEFLAKHAQEKVIVFFLTCASVDYFATIMPKLSTIKQSRAKIYHLHGKMSSKKRQKQFGHFKATKNGALFCTDVAARGIDLPDLTWIVQFDPPLDPSFFVHRVGRTSRAGRRGSAVVMLMPGETGYAEYLKSRKVPISHLDSGGYSSLIPRQDNEESISPPEIAAAGGGGGGGKGGEESKANSSSKGRGLGGKDNTNEKNQQQQQQQQRLLSLSEVHKLAAKDRAIMDLGQRAFVSFVRAYKEHELAYTMMFSMLPFAGIASGYGLLFFPRMPDIKHFKIEFKPPLNIKARDIKYKDKNREKQRLKNMQARREKNEQERKAREALEAERQRKKRKEKPKRRRKRVHQEIKSEWEELQREVNMMKKLKKGKMSKKDFLKAVGEAEDDDDDTDK